MVQHYEYTAFGKARLQKESQAFSVTNRYTGQKIDEDTGLYFYGSRYYDPELARFIQADTIIPSSTTSQTLNRYTYVNNNPLKFTDPTGHGWFSDFFKKFIGTIITVALNILVPGAGTLLQLAFAAIGSAVSTAVNGGTFASFAIGMGIGLAAGCISNAMGVSLFGKNNWGAFIKDPIGMFAAGALQGSIMGAISSAVYGQNIWKGMGEGALGGAIGAGVALSTEAAISFGASVIKDMDLALRGDRAYLTIARSDGRTYTVTIHSAMDLAYEVLKVKSLGYKITFFEYYGHGFGIEGQLDQRGEGLVIGKGGFMTGRVLPQNYKDGYYGFDNLRNAIIKTFAPDAVIELEACYSAYGTNSIAHSFKAALPNARVYGYTGKAWPSLIPFHRESWRGPYIFTSSWVEVK